MTKSSYQAFQKIPGIFTSTLKNYQALLPLHFPKNLSHLCSVNCDLTVFTVRSTFILCSPGDEKRKNFSPGAFSLSWPTSGLAQVVSKTRAVVKGVYPVHAEKPPSPCLGVRLVRRDVPLRSEKAENEQRVTYLDILGCCRPTRYFGKCCWGEKHRSLVVLQMQGT